MTDVKRCDGCGVIGEAPYEGWLKVSSFAREDDDDAEKSAHRLWKRTRPVLTFEVCGHECLPSLAFERSHEFLLKETA